MRTHHYTPSSPETELHSDMFLIYVLFQMQTRLFFFAHIHECDIMAALPSLAVCVYVTSHTTVNTAYSYVQWHCAVV